MKRLAIAMGLLTAVYAMSFNAAAGAAEAGPNSVAPIRPDIFVPPPANRTAHGSQPSGRFQLGNAPGTEVPSLRTRTSRTFATGNGNLVAKIASEPINYLDASGRWEPIDNALIARPGGYRNKGADYSVLLPSRIESAPIRVVSGPAWIEYQLQGASGPGSISGSVETFDKALPGVTLEVAAKNRAVKETLVLQDGQAPTRFNYQLRMSSGLRLVQEGVGPIRAVNTSGHTIFTLPAPTMADSEGAKGEIRQRLIQTTSGQQLQISALASWVGSLDRKWPIVIDPTITLNGGDCSITNNPTYFGCINAQNWTDDSVGWDGTYAYRTLIQFDVTSIPSNSQVLNADLYVTEMNGAAIPISVFPVTRPWTGAAGWTTYDGTHSWTTPGGDFSATPSYTAAGVACCTTPLDWYPTVLAQAWVNGTLANNGVILKTTENVVGTFDIASPANSICVHDPQQCVGNGPFLSIVYEPWTGKQRFFTFDSHSLTDRLDLAVNVANGNLVFHAKDFSIHGTGLDLTVDRWYNSQADTTSQFGPKWVMGTGHDVGLVFYGDGSAAYFGPSGYQIPFIKDPDGTFTAPTGIDAALVRNTDGTFTFLAHKNGTKENFSSGGYLRSQVDQNGNTISLAYNTDNTLASITDTQGRVSSMTYMSGLVSKIVDPGSRTYQFAYDANKRLTSATDPAGKPTQFAYDSGSNLTQITDPNGNQTRIAYATGSRVASITYVTNPGTGSGFVETFTYNAGNTIVTNPNGNNTTYYYDFQARVTKIVDPLGNMTTASYTPNSDPAQTNSPSGGRNTYQYDGLNNPTSVAATGGPSKSMSYGDSQHPYYPTATKSTTNSTVGYSYNSSGNVVQRTDPSGHTTTYTYNSGGQPLSATDALGYTTTWQYDQYGNLTKVTYPSPLGAETFTYDSLSRLSTRTDGKGQRTTYSYDALDRLAFVSFADGRSVSASYDDDGNATASTDPTGTTTRTYNPLNQLTRETTPAGQSIGYGWDGVGNLISETDAGGTITQQFDAVGSLSAIIGRNGGKTTVQNNVASGTQSWAYPNGVTETFTSNNLGQVTKVSAANASAAILTSITYNYVNPATGQPTDLRFSATDAAGNVTSYGYDPMGRLTGATTTSSGGSTLASYQYVYDPVGNITSQNLNGTSTAMSYNGADELTQAASTTYSYDLAGNMLGNSAGMSFSYNAMNQTASITPSGGSPLNMTYRGIGQSTRVQAGSTGFQYDLGGIDSMSVGGGTSYFTRLPNSFLLSETTSTGTYYYLHDVLGSVIALTDSGGNVVNRYAYDPYGNTVSQSEAVSNPFRWIGAVWDGTTQLYKMGDRYYSSTLGRFTQVDPAHQCTNGYAYAGDNPINISDPSGDFWWSCGLSVQWAGGWGWWWTQAVAWCFFDLNKFDIASIGFIAGRAAGVLAGTGPWGWVAAFAVWAFFYILTNIAPMGFWVYVWVVAGAYWRAWPWTFSRWFSFGIAGGLNTWCNTNPWLPWAWCI